MKTIVKKIRGCDKSGGHCIDGRYGCGKGGGDCEKGRVEFVVNEMLITMRVVVK